MDLDDDQIDRADIDITLRTRQAQYLEYLSERDGEPLSRSLEKIITRADEVLMLDSPGRTQKIRKHVMIMQTCVGFLDRLSSLWGLSRSDVVRRLIDDALARDPTL